MDTDQRLKGWYSVAEISEELGISTHIARSLIHRGELPAKKIGREYRVKADDLALWISDRKVTT